VSVGISGGLHVRGRGMVSAGLHSEDRGHL